MISLRPYCRRIAIFAVLFPLCALLRAEGVDSVACCYDLGFQYLKERQYASAYKAFRYYLDNVSPDEKNTDRYEKARRAFYGAKSEVAEELSHCYEEAVSASRRGEQTRAEQTFQRYLSMCVTEESRQTHEYTVALTHYAVALQRKGKLDEAMLQLKRAEEVRRTAAYMNRSHVAETLNHMAAIENQRGRYDEAIAKCTEALEIYEKYLGKKHDHYGVTLSNLAGYYTTRNAPGDRAHAVELGEQAVQILSRNSPAYAQAMNNLVLYYSLSGDKVKAQKYSKIALQSMKKMQTNTIHYASLLSNHAVRLANAGNYEQALEYAREAIGIYETNEETQSLNFARLLSNAASFEKHMERYEEAITLWQRAAPIYENIEGKSSSGYLNCMSEISAAHTRTGNLEKAANISEQLQTTVSEQVNRGDVRFAQSLTKQASIMAANGNYTQALSLEQQALAIYRVRGDVAGEASCLKDISGYLYHMNRLPEAIDTCKLALSIYGKVPGHEEDRALALNSLSIYYYANGAYEDALNTSREAVDDYGKTGNTNSSLFAKMLTNQALYEVRRDSLGRALALNQRADTIQRRILGDMHPDNVMLMFNMANLYLRMDRKYEAQRLFHAALAMQMQNVRSNFSHLTTRGRELYWGTKSYIFRAAPAMACLMENVDSALIDAYNSQLFTKGLLLNSEVDFRNLLARTASTDLRDKYDRLVAIRQEIEQAWRNPSDDARAQIPSLMSSATRLERELVRGCKEYGDFTEAMSIDFSQVVKALGSGDAAIEFFDLDTPEDGRTYWALLARHDAPAPTLIRLFSEGELDRLRFGGLPLTQALTRPDGINEVFESTQVGQFVWGRLIPYLDGVENIWFAPSGLFYQWGIEYLRYDHRRIGDLYALHRVSSTKLLVQQDRTSQTVSLAAVFGGIRYNATPAEIQAANKEYEDIYKRADEFMADTDSDLEDWALAETRTLEGFLRDGQREVGFLPGTVVEAEKISQTLLMHGVETQKYDGVYGTEEAFKGLSGKGVSLLHVATHGFSLSEDAVRRSTNTMSYLEVSGEESSQADNSLCYSGLLLAGANNVITGKKVPSGIENGVLTAREIAKLDFRGLDLAVLSACQTGLGELKEDGVFGLQRGFKKAGARTLLMSLWSVSDGATQLMMTEFYSALVSGQTRRQAFRTAQEAVRNTPEYSSPVFWASFVMLDD